MFSQVAAILRGLSGITASSDAIPGWRNSRKRIEKYRTTNKKSALLTPRPRRLRATGAPRNHFIDARMNSKSKDITLLRKEIESLGGRNSIMAQLLVLEPPYHCIAAPSSS